MTKATVLLALCAALPCSLAWGESQQFTISVDRGLWSKWGFAYPTT